LFHVNGVNVVFCAPQTLLPTHGCDGFANTESELDALRMRRTYVNQLNGASRTFVPVDAQDCDQGFARRLSDLITKSLIYKDISIFRSVGLRASR